MCAFASETAEPCRVYQRESARRDRESAGGAGHVECAREKAARYVVRTKEKAARHVECTREKAARRVECTREKAAEECGLCQSNL